MWRNVENTMKNNNLGTHDVSYLDKFLIGGTYFTNNNCCIFITIFVHCNRGLRVVSRRNLLFLGIRMVLKA